MPPLARPARLRADVDVLVDLVAGLDFGLASAAQGDRRARRDETVHLLQDYLEPRLARPDRPLVVVVFGPTGSGKSTLLNTLAGRAISTAGPLRPTTTGAVAWVHAGEAQAVASSPLARTGDVEVVADDHPMLRRLTILDTPDIDSIEVEHRRQTEAILTMADVAVAVTTPQRYADAVPWDLLARLAERGLDPVVVMNRAARRSSAAVSDLAALLRDARMGGVVSADDVIVVQEQRTRADGLLPSASVRRLVTRLEGLAGEHARVALAGVETAVGHAARVARELSAAVEEQAAEAEALGRPITSAVDAQREEIEARLARGELVRDEVVARWQRLVGVSDLAEVVTRGAARLRALLTPGGPIDDGSIRRVESEVRAELVELGMRRAARARSTIELAWSTSSAGRALLASVRPEPGRARERLESEVAEWQGEVVALVAAAGRGRFRLARAATVGINAAATLVLLGVFASTGGITGAEVGVAAGAAAAQQTVLERMFGAAAAGRLARTARVELGRRLLLAVEDLTAPFSAALDSVVDDVQAAEELRDAATRLELTGEEYTRG